MTQDELRHTSFSTSPEDMAEQCGENARDANAALGRRVVGYTKTVQRYCATASTSTQLPLISSTTAPAGVLLVRVSTSDAPSSPVAVTPTLGWVFANGLVGVFEPNGLTSNTYYNLTFLILE